MPEQVDGDWYWFDAGAGQQHLAQNAFEKAVVSAGYRDSRRRQHQWSSSAGTN
jgi:hypothetical protein